MRRSPRVRTRARPGSGGLRPAEEIALQVVTAEFDGCVSFLFALDPLGDHLDAEILADAGQGTHDALLDFGFVAVLDEQAVELDELR
jgi:hypothetical protein